MQQQHSEARLDLRVLHAPTTVVRFAIEANLDAHPTRSEGPPVRGRQALARALSIGAAGLTGRLKTRQGLGRLAQEVEALGFAEAGTVTRLAEQVELLKAEPWSIGAHWWPVLRDGYGLGSSNIEPNFHRAFEILIAAEAFAAAHPHLLRRPPNKPDSSAQIDEKDLSACRLLINQLCWLASGPFGVSYESQRLISYLAPLSPETVTDFISSGVITTQVIRALDRSLRRSTWNNTMREKYTDLLANPPSKIYRRTNWLRALRRLRLLDYSDATRSQIPKRDWLTNQLVIAFKGELSYAGARATDRRYAFWCIAELEQSPKVWSEIQATAHNDIELLPLLTPAKLLRQGIAAVGLGKTDAFQFTPSGGWAAQPENRHWSDLLDLFVTDNAKGPLDHWRWTRPQTRVVARALLQDALFNPDVIKQRSSTDALGAAGTEMREAVAIAVSQFVIAILGEANAPLYLIERALAVLGMMGRLSSTGAVEIALRQLQNECLIQAVASAGDIAYRHPSATPWLMATVIEVIRQSLHNEDLVIAGITAMVAGRRDPRQALSELEDLPSTAIQATLIWADRVRHDRARLEQLGSVESYPASYQP